MVSAWRNFKNIFSRPLLTIIFRPKMIKFYPYSILTGEGRVDFFIYCMLKGYQAEVKWRKGDLLFFHRLVNSSKKVDSEQISFRAYLRNYLSGFRWSLKPKSSWFFFAQRKLKYTRIISQIVYGHECFCSKCYDNFIAIVCL